MIKLSNIFFCKNEKYSENKHHFSEKNNVNLPHIVKMNNHLKLIKNEEIITYSYCSCLDGGKYFCTRRSERMCLN